MIEKRFEISDILMDKVADWLTKSSLAGDDLETMVRGFCERLAAAGLPLRAVHLSFSMLHPLYDALGFTWERGRGMEVEGFRKKTGLPLRTVPAQPLLSSAQQPARAPAPPHRSDAPSEFPIFDDLKKIGVTDYIAFVHSFSLNASQGMIGSWSTDAPDGFSESAIAALLRIQNHLAVASKMAVLDKLADNMLTTYLGGDAGKRVLNGQIRRGDGDTIRAALVMADMRGSTKLAETRRPRRLYRDAQPVLRCHRCAVQPQRRARSCASSETAFSPSIRASAIARPRKSPARPRWPPRSRPPPG